MNNDKNSHQITSSGTTAQPEQTVPDTNPSKRLSYKEWREKFRPIKNPFTDSYFHGTLFRPDGVEFEMVRTFPLRQIWSVVCEDDLCSLISNSVFGIDHIFGFIITEVDAPQERLPEILVWQHEEFDDEINHE
jgi:hypothetical protein